MADITIGPVVLGCPAADDVERTVLGENHGARRIAPVLPDREVPSGAASEVIRELLKPALIDTAFIKTSSKPESEADPAVLNGSHRCENDHPELWHMEPDQTQAFYVEEVSPVLVPRLGSRPHLNQESMPVYVDCNLRYFRGPVDEVEVNIVGEILNDVSTITLELELEVSRCRPLTITQDIWTMWLPRRGYPGGIVVDVDAVAVDVHGPSPEGDIRRSALPVRNIQARSIGAELPMMEPASNAINVNLTAIPKVCS